MNPSKPTRILHLIETGGPGGAERMLLGLARHLGPTYASTIGLLKSGWLQAEVLSSGIPCVMVRGNGAGDLGVVANLVKVVRQHAIELIHTHEFFMSVMGAAISRLTGIPLVMTVHGKNYYPDKYRRRVLYRLAAAQATSIVAVSHDLRRFFCQTTGLDPNRVLVIHNGIELRSESSIVPDPRLRESVGIPPDASVVATVGNLYPVKGHTYLIRAAKIIFQRRPNTHVIILGRGSQKDTLTEEAGLLGIKDRIHLLGYCDDVSSWLAQMNVFTLPSLSEGLPLSLLEAMAAGIPSVVTAVGGMPEVVRDGDSGFLVPPGDPEALATQILFLLDHPAVAANVGAAGRNLVREKFSILRMVREYFDLYKKALVPSRTGCTFPAIKTNSP